jgi:hypothetical protein
VMRPELKIILYSGATDVPRNEMTSIDIFVSKADGITALIAEVAELTQFVGGSPTALTRDAEQLYRVHTHNVDLEPKASNRLPSGRPGWKRAT